MGRRNGRDGVRHPSGWRSPTPLGGAAYGLAILGVFEVAAAQWLGIGKKERAIWERFALAGDHVLYGIVLVDESEGRLSG